MSANGEKLADFQRRPVTYIETIQVKDGVECDTYSFDGNPSEDLAIVQVTPGTKTPLQESSLFRESWLGLLVSGTIYYVSANYHKILSKSLRPYNIRRITMTSSITT